MARRQRSRGPPLAVQEKGLYRGKAGNKMSLPLCSRSKDVIEPMLKPQWCARGRSDAHVCWCTVTPVAATFCQSAMCAGCAMYGCAGTIFLYVVLCICCAT